MTELVGAGLPTAAIAAQLYLSTYTVQDHLKAIFEKLDVSSRGELVARLFVDHSLSPARPTRHALKTWWGSHRPFASWSFL